MTYELGMRHELNSAPIPSETNMHPDAQESKRAHQINNILDRILYLTTDSHGLSPVRAKMDDFDLTTVLMPPRHLPGYIRQARFENGLWIRATTHGQLVDQVHTLLLYTDGNQHTYEIEGMNVDREAHEPPIRMVGVEEIAGGAGPDGPVSLGKIEERLETQRLNHWPKVLSPGDLAVAWKARHQQ